MNDLFKKLFIFEMANNHMGDVGHGLRMIQEFAQVKSDFDFNFAFKFQFRNIDSFIHPLFKDRQDLKYVKRFQETKLSFDDFARLKDEADKFGFKSICTPFDEESVDQIQKLNFDAIKIASCSFTDWPLLEKVATTDTPIIASTAGATLAEIDRVVNFFTAGDDQRLNFDTHRNKQLAIMHCVGEYPTKTEDLELNQITLLKNRYPNIAIGFSTHEEPNETDAVKLAVAKGAEIFEKHVAVETDEFPKNAYSATPEQAYDWLLSAKRAIEICGSENIRNNPASKELNDLRQFKRGVYALEDVEGGQEISEDLIFYAFPNQPGQLLANDISNTIDYKCRNKIKALEPVNSSNVTQKLKRNEGVVNRVIEDVKKMLNKASVSYPGRANFELSHHYGIDKIYEFGTVMLTVVNREYCKKLIISLPGQSHPEQYHLEKEETFHVLDGELSLLLDGNPRTLRKGDVCTIERGVRHSFSSESGAIIEELSTSHNPEDSYYTDDSIMKNQERKTILQ